MLLAEDLARPFDLATQPPVRFRIVRHTGCHLLLAVVHRIAADDRSLQLATRQVRAAYRGRTIPAAPLDYADFSEWQRVFSAGLAARRHLDYWRTALADPPPAELPADRSRPPVRDRRAGTVRFDVPPGVARPLYELAAGHDATPLVGLLAGLHAVLARRAGGGHVAVGVPVSGRDRPELEHVIGMIEETAVVRVDLTDCPCFDDLLARVREAVLAATDHAVLPFEDIVAAVADAAENAPEPGRHPLFDVFFALRGVPAEPPAFPPPDAVETRVDLACHLTERPDGGLDGRFEYAVALFDESTIADLAASYVELLALAAANLHAPVTDPPAHAARPRTPALEPAWLR